MTRDDQRTFVEDVLDDCKAALLRKVGRVPEDWDGHELRAWIGGYMQDQYANVGQIYSHPRSRRAKAFRNAVITLNL